MKISMRTMGLGLMVATLVSLCGVSSTYAFPGQEARLRPLVPPPVNSPVVPRLGIMGHIHHGRGMHVETVIRGTTAGRIGLERGDVILRINGQEIENDRDYRQALVQAARFDKGVVRLLVADVRTGRRVVRTGVLNSNPGIDFGNHNHPHHGNVFSKTSGPQDTENSEF